MEKICKNCRHFVKGLSECRRYPPNNGYSKTSENLWCGEFKKIKKEKVPEKRRSIRPNKSNVGKPGLEL